MQCADPDVRSAESSLDGTRAKFDRYLTTIRLILTRGMQYFLPFWYAKEPMFWLPHGWFPYYAEWLLSFPRAPMGSVSITSWQVACTGALSIITDTIMAVIGLVWGAKQPQATPVSAKGGKAKEGAQPEKKEL